LAARLTVSPEVLDWAISRSNLREANRSAFKKLSAWKLGEESPTFKQLLAFAHATYTPIGYLLLDSPPKETLPIQDFRTFANKQLKSLSANLLDVTQECLGRQEWFRDYSIRSGYEPLPFVGSRNTGDNVAEAASWLRRELRFEVSDRSALPKAEDAVRFVASGLEELGCLVMSSGIVGGNTHRKLDAAEFRGFAIADGFAPLIFVNSNDTKAGKLFSLIHEFGHILLGESGVSGEDNLNSHRETSVSNTHELWCNRLAAEVLVPKEYVIAASAGVYSKIAVNEISKQTKASSLVVIKQFFTLGIIDWSTYESEYSQELQIIRDFLASSSQKTGGDYYRTQTSRLSRNFIRAVVSDTYAGNTLHRDAYELLGTKKSATFEKLAAGVGIL